MAEQSQCVITVEEAHIPIRKRSGDFCEILGLDPCFWPMKARWWFFCAAADAENVLASMQAHEYGKRLGLSSAECRKKDGGALSSYGIGGAGD